MNDESSVCLPAISRLIIPKDAKEKYGKLARGGYKASFRH